jgi:predicted transcriptional regulator
MAKVPASTRIEESLYRRLEVIAKVDRRSISELVEMCIEDYLPTMEAQQEAKKAALRSMEADKGLSPVGPGAGKPKRRVA